MSDFGGLTEADVRLYRCVLQAPGRAPGEYAAKLGAGADVFDPALHRLQQLGLLVAGPGAQLSAVSPMLAEVTALSEEDYELGARRAALEQRRDAIRRLVPEWADALQGSATDAAVEIVAEPGAMANALLHHADRGERELLTISPGRLPATRIDGRARVATVTSARRGVRTRALYQYVALRDRATRTYLDELAHNGAHVRLTAALPARALVVDRAVALLPLDGDEPRLVIVRERHLIAWLVATFEQLWSESGALDAVIHREPDDEDLDPTRAAIVRLMAEGEKDEAIARKLSISVRTCRRHIADYMAQVGATSRFQAGVIAARAGHTDVIR